jgi:ABC-2 type transport system permease protein
MLYTLFKIYKAFVRFSFSKASEFRFDSFFRILMDLAFVLQFYLLIDVTFETTSSLAGWGRSQAMLFFALFLVADALHMVLVDPNVEELARLVVRGGFDYYLLRPVPTLFQVLLREISLPSIVNLLFALWCLGYTLNQLPWEFTLVESLLLIAILINGFLLTAALRLIFTLGVFWGMSERALLPIHWAFSVMFEKPHVIYTGILRVVGMSLLPFALTASLPAEILSLPSDSRTFHLMYLIGMSGIFYLITLIAWRAALRNYASASS